MRFALPFLVVLFVGLAHTPGQPKEKPKQAAPRALYALQLGADPGKTTKLTIRGINVDTATEVRLGDPKSTGKVVGKGRAFAISTMMNLERVGGSEIEIEVTLPAEVPGGSVPLSLVGPGGEGKAMTLLVNDDTPRLSEMEPNDGFKSAMSITAPVVVEATFKQTQDVDVFRIEGKAGDKYRIEIQATRYGSPAEPMLTVYDAAGRTIATGEPIGDSKDPAVFVVLPKDGVFFASVIEGFDQGAANFVYRLRIRKD